MTIIYAILMFSILIFVHELGHFLAAKACKVKVNDFAIGMGPSLYKRTKGETTYHLKAFPIGGFCAMEGEDEESDLENAFNNKSAWQKTIIVCAGAFMNLITAIILMTIVVYFSGFPTTTIDKVLPNTPASSVGIQAGDKILKLNNKPISDWEELGLQVQTSGKTGKKILISVERNSKELEILTPVKEVEKGKYAIGVISAKERSLGKSIILGPSATYNLGVKMFDVIGQLFTGKLSPKNLSGPVGIIYMVDKSAAVGFMSVLFLMALISLNLAIFNMLPFPALDGGRLIFIIIRKITGKAITDKMEGYVHIAGMVFLLSLTVYVTWQDILRFIVPIFK